MSISKLGYWSGVAACASTVAFGVVQILQVAGVLRFPADEILIYGTSLCIVVPLIPEMLTLHHLTPAYTQFWTYASLTFIVICVIFVSANYVVQLATVIPAKRRGEAEAIRRRNFKRGGLSIGRAPLPCEKRRTGDGPPPPRRCASGAGATTGEMTLSLRTN